MIDSPASAMDIPHHEPPVTLRSQTAAIEAVEDIVYGSTAGIVGKYIEYPFDTVKVRLQSQPDNLPLRYKGPIDCFRQSLKADGFVGLYRGITAPLVGAAAETSSLFFFERLGRELIYSSGLVSRDQFLSLPTLYFTGAFSGFFTSYVLTPIELVKCKIQAPASADGSAPPPLKPGAVIRDVYRHHGIKGFWHGQMGTLIRESGGSAAWFGGKETVTKMFHALNARTVNTKAEKDTLAAQPLPLWQQALAGASAGVSYNFLFFPADTIKSRLQTMAIGESVKDRTFLKEGIAIWKRYGAAGLYRGCGITCLRSAPSSAFIFMVFDGLKTFLPMQ
ncbi:amino-acid transporter arg-13 [Sodiomyces alkalinus F11]|uniref:Amino-acid transporter arg-13 n=1 Tax=Sodiomyces alkalinus (strain CBS 110278 / VKM F-3762 / F11) TaxID=1314773 RepID=A0A3N2PSJ7_SODAK|nr:amino-acid transporter arg-13 [Sodiomyces alkalinus F11]ROT37458.1 amino-acid transporter arg-13 [Sodiomyces alkalinus F11]